MDDNKRIKKLNFTPSSWWIQCRICKVCIQDEDKFIAHILSKHPSLSSSSPTASSNENSEDDESSETSRKGHAVGSTDESEDYSEDENFRVKQATNLIKTEPSALCGTVLGSVPERPEHKEALLNEWTSRVFGEERVLAVDLVAIEIVDRTTTRTDHPSCADEALHKSNDNPILRLAGSSCTATNLLGNELVPPPANSTNSNDRVTLVEEQVEEQPEGRLLAESRPIVPDLTTHPQNIGTLENTSALPDKLHKCCICLKKFTFRANLNCHLSVVHLSKSGPRGERILKCGICPKTFSKRKHLSHHSWIHTKNDEHRFKCPQCMTGFTRKSLFKTHSKQCCKT
ncbi:zinc finger protein 583 isoform X2 [Folsomia candida]|uniref:PR domain zinc finger protein 4 n=1 Tax=Folsomia candida TaxID=158441 RepID=A0A226E3K2_FOLCA|nr:zinc finger protein 583 isoform X2 [Folsomia candida]OXA52173.1 PR domain zinc finger protein 4 [Folsomia candida]